MYQGDGLNKWVDENIITCLRDILNTLTHYDERILQTASRTEHAIYRSAKWLIYVHWAQMLFIWLIPLHYTSRLTWPGVREGTVLITHGLRVNCLSVWLVRPGRMQYGLGDNGLAPVQYEQ